MFLACVCVVIGCARVEPGASAGTDEQPASLPFMVYAARDVSDDGRYAALLAYTPDLVRQDIVIWDLDEGRSKRLARNGGNDLAQIAGFSGPTALVVAQGGKIEEWDFLKDTVRTIKSSRGRIGECRLIGRSDRILYNVARELIGAWIPNPLKAIDLSGAEIARVTTSPCSSSICSVSSDGRLVATRMDEGRGVCLVDVESYRVLTSFRGFPSNVTNVVFKPDNSKVVVCVADGSAVVVNVRTGLHETSLVGHKKRLWGDWSPSGRIVLADESGLISVWKEGLECEFWLKDEAGNGKAIVKVVQGGPGDRCVIARAPVKTGDLYGPEHVRVIVLGLDSGKSEKLIEVGHSWQSLPALRTRLEKVFSSEPLRDTGL